MKAIDSELYRLFARFLEYPNPGMEGLVRQAIGKLQPTNPQAAEALNSFLQFVEQVPNEQLEEVYTHTFDIKGVCYPYVGHHLFGESYQRSWFMARLNREYRLWSYSPGNELPDYIPVVLGFLALGYQYEFSQTLLDEGLIPAMKKMVNEFEQNVETPYCHVIRAILLALSEGETYHPGNSTGSDTGGVDHA